MKRWPTKPLPQLCRPKQWPTLAKKDLSSSGYPVYGANGKIGFADSYTHEHPTILIGCRGSCGTIHVTEPKSYATGNAMALDNLDTISVSLPWVVHFFRHRGFADVVTGSSQPQLTQQGLARVEVPVPPLAVQERIVKLLDEADELRKLRAQADHRTAALLPALFHKMFGDPATNPERWPVMKLIEVTSPKQWPTITQDQLTASGFPVYGANGRIGFYSAFNHETPTVLITCRGATCGTINVCAPKSYVTGNAMALDDPNPELLNVSFLESVLRVRGVQDTITGTAQPQITRQSLARVSFPVPALPLQQEFAQRVAEIRAMETAQAASRQRLESLFQSLLHRAFNGEL